MRFLLLCVVALVTTSAARGEFPALQRVVQPALTEALPKVKGRTVVVAARSGKPFTWRLPAAIQTELVACLRAAGIEAVDAESEPELIWLSRSARAFTADDVGRWRKTAKFKAALLAELKTDGALHLNLHGSDAGESQWSAKIPVPAETLTSDANTPELNRKVAAFVRGELGKQVGNGECWTLAEQALKSAGANRSGVYIFGRELADHEALLPGDVIQLEHAQFRSDDGSRSAQFSHHTVIVEASTAPNVVQILQQNFGSAGKTVSRYTLHPNELRDGMMAGFRPANGDGPLPAVSPRRRLPAKVVKNNAGVIDLLRTLDPKLDTCRGIWFFEKTALHTPKDPYTRLQLPVEVLKAYVLRADVTRVFGTDTFGIGLVVGGQQTLLAIDSYGGTCTGLHPLDGKPVDNNPSTVKTRLLTDGKVVKLECRVEPSRVSLKADGKSVLDWKGNANRLSMEKNYAVPHTNWLFLAAYDTVFDISKLTLEPLR